MLSDSQTILRTLEAELNFLERGGYRRKAGTSWRSPYIFEDSPSCPNFSDRARPHECKDCWLMQFVPRDMHEEQVPCRFVQLTPDGLTVDSLYRYGTPSETDAALRRWLHERIHELNEELSRAARLPFAI